MFCPNCGAQYHGDSRVCPSCNVSLVADPPGQRRPEVTGFVTVYETGNPAFIAFAKSIFETEGIQYFIKGEGLQDLFGGGRLGTGFNPVIGPAQIQVDAKDAEKAKDLLTQIEQGKFELAEADTGQNLADPPQESPAGKQKGKGFIKGLIIGLLISGIAFCAYYYREKYFSGVLRYDLNKDSKPDLFYTYKNGVLVKTEEDRNSDGRIDNWVFYKDGIPDRSESDDDFDQRVDTWSHYKLGTVTRIEIDTNGDNQPEIIEEYANGILSTKSWYHESSRKIWKKAYFASGNIKEEYVDQDYDGTIDIKITYNPSERPVKRDSLH